MIYSSHFDLFCKHSFTDISITYNTSEITRTKSEKILAEKCSNQYANNLKSKFIHASLFILQACDKKSSSMISLRRKLLLWEIKLPHRLKVEHFFGVNAKTLYQI